MNKSKFHNFIMFNVILLGFWSLESRLAIYRLVKSGTKFSKKKVHQIFLALKPVGGDTW